MTSDDVLRLLAQRHAGDVFVPECKDGPTHAGSHRRLDAWAMNRSWANATTYGYEIKVSRRDFLADEKWHDYLRLCNVFFFVCPAGMIAPEETPEGCGLLWVATTGSRLYTKRKAPRRDVPLDESLVRYVLMCRVRITRDPIEGRLEHWRQWLRERRERRAIGYEVKGQIRRLYYDAVQARELAEAKVRTYERIRALIRELGFDPDTDSGSWKVDQALREKFSSDVSEVATRARYMSRQLAQFADELAGETG